MIVLHIGTGRHSLVALDTPLDIRDRSLIVEKGLRCGREAGWQVKFYPHKKGGNVLAMLKEGHKRV